MDALSHLAALFNHQLLGTFSLAVTWISLPCFPIHQFSRRFAGVVESNFHASGITCSPCYAWCSGGAASTCRAFRYIMRLAIYLTVLFVRRAFRYNRLPDTSTSAVGAVADPHSFGGLSWSRCALYG